MSTDNDTTRLIEERIRDHYNARILDGKSDCDYRVAPADFMEMVKRLKAKVELGHFVTLYLSAGVTRVYPTPEVGRDAYEPCESARPKMPSLVDQLSEALLKGALRALADQRDYSSAAALVHAYTELQDARTRASFGRTSGLETGAALRQGDRLV